MFFRVSLLTIESYGILSIQYSTGTYNAGKMVECVIKYRDIRLLLI